MERGRGRPSFASINKGPTDSGSQTKRDASQFEVAEDVFEKRMRRLSRERMERVQERVEQIQNSGKRSSSVLPDLYSESQVGSSTFQHQKSREATPLRLATSTFQSMGIEGSTSNKSIPYSHCLSPTILPHVKSIYDPPRDGNCGYHSVAQQVGNGDYKKVRLECLDELRKRKAFYKSLLIVIQSSLTY